MALAPALRRLPALEHLAFTMATRSATRASPDTALVSTTPYLVAPPLSVGAPPTPTAGLVKLKELYLSGTQTCTQITDAGCAALIKRFHQSCLYSIASKSTTSIL